MRKLLFFLILFSFCFLNRTFSQGFIITQPRLEINGTNLVIIYDIVTNSKSDLFYVWVEIERVSGERIHATSFSGDIGEYQKAGSNKRIEWASLKDSVSIDEEIFVMVKAEKYIILYNKGSALIKSTVFPGWGQTKISGSKPWWLTGVAFYGVLAGGIIYNQKSRNSYDSYRTEENRDTRANLLVQSQSQLKVSDGLFLTAAGLWAANMLWVAVSPEKYKPLQHARLTVNPAASALTGNIYLSVMVNF